LRSSRRHGRLVQDADTWEGLDWALLFVRLETLVHVGQGARVVGTAEAVAVGDSSDSQSLLAALPADDAVVVEPIESEDAKQVKEKLDALCKAWCAAYSAYHIMYLTYIQHGSHESHKCCHTS
jgi:hypothetical protein